MSMAIFTGEVGSMVLGLVSFVSARLDYHRYSVSTAPARRGGLSDMRSISTPYSPRISAGMSFERRLDGQRRGLVRGVTYEMPDFCFIVSSMLLAMGVDNGR